MKQVQIIKAIKTLDKIFENSKVIKPMTISFGLYKLRKKLQEHWDWQYNQQMAINEKLDAEGMEGTEREAAYNAALAEVVLSDVEPDWEVVQIPKDADIVINPIDFITLEGFIEIV